MSASLFLTQLERRLFGLLRGSLCFLGFCNSYDFGRSVVGVFRRTLIYLNLFTICLTVQANRQVLPVGKQNLYSATVAAVITFVGQVWLRS